MAAVIGECLLISEPTLRRNPEKRGGRSHRFFAIAPPPLDEHIGLVERRELLARKQLVAERRTWACAQPRSRGIEMDVGKSRIRFQPLVSDWGGEPAPVVIGLDAVTSNGPSVRRDRNWFLLSFPRKGPGEE